MRHLDVELKSNGKIKKKCTLVKSYLMWVSVIGIRQKRVCELVHVAHETVYRFITRGTLRRQDVVLQNCKF